MNNERNCKNHNTKRLKTSNYNIKIEERKTKEDRDTNKDIITKERRSGIRQNNNNNNNKNKITEKNIPIRKGDYKLGSKYENNYTKALNQMNNKEEPINKNNNINKKTLKISLTNQLFNRNNKKSNPNFNNYNLYNSPNLNYNSIDNYYEEKYKENDNISNRNKKIQYNKNNDFEMIQDYQNKNDYYKINNNAISVNQNIQNKYRPINNNVNYKTIDVNNDDIYNYSDNKRKINKKDRITDRDDLDNIKNERSFNCAINNNNYYLINSINSNDKIIGEIKIKNLTNCNFPKNSILSGTYCSPNKKLKISNRRTIDDKINNNNEKILDNNEIENRYKILKNKNIVYRKAHRNDSCVKGGKKCIRNLGNEFNNINQNINLKTNLDNSFNSSFPNYIGKNERNSISYMNESNSIQRMNTQNRSLNRKTDNKVEVSELYNREKSKSKYITIQNAEDVYKNCSPKKNNKTYYYQSIDGNKITKGDKMHDYNNYYNNANILNQNKKKKQQSKKNNIIYENNVNSFDRNNGNKVNNNDNYKINYNKKSCINSPSVSDYNNENQYEEENNIILDSATEHIYNSKPRNTNYNRVNNYNSNNYNKIIYKTKKISTNSLRRKKFSNSFNNDLIKNEHNDNDYNEDVNELQKNCRTLIINRDHNYNKYNLKNKMNIDNNSFIYKNKNIINNTGRSSPKYIIKNASTPINFENENDDYFYNNSKTIEDFYKDKNQYTKNLKDNSFESSNSKSKKRLLYHKKNSQNHFGINNARLSIEVNNPKFNKTFYSKKDNIKKENNNNIYLKKKITEFNTTNENKKYNKEQTDTYSINSTHNSNNTKNNNLSYKKKNQKTFNNSFNEDYIIEKEEIIYKVNEIIKNNHSFYKKFYNYYVKKPENKIYYIEKYIKNKKKNIKDTNKLNNDNNNNNSINISNISDNKNNECDGFNVSFNNNKNKKKKIPSEENMLNEKNLAYDDDYLKDNSEENIELGKLNDKNNKINISLELLEEKGENVGVPKKDNDNDNDLNKKNIKLNEDNYDEKDDMQIKSGHFNLDKNQNELHNNYLSNSTSKKKPEVYSNKYSNNNELSQKISLAAKKLINIFNKKNDNNKSIKNKQNKKEIRRSMTEQEFAIGCSKLNDIFDRNSNNNINNSFKGRIKTNKEKRSTKQYDENEIIEEVLNDNDIDDNNMGMKLKTYTYKIKNKHKLSEEENDNNKVKQNNKKKIYNIEQILSFKNNSLSLKDNLLNDQVKSHIKNLLDPEYKTNKINRDSSNEIYNITKKLDNKNNKTKNNEQTIEDKMNNILDLLNESNINYKSEELENIIVYYDNSNKSPYRLRRRLLSKKYLDNFNIFINIIFDKISKEQTNISIYSQLCKKINTLLLKRSNNNTNEEYLQNIFLDECLKRINNKEYLNYNENNKNNFFNLINFIFELISSKIIKIEKSLNIINDLFKNYENSEDNQKYLYLEGCINLFDSILDENILELPENENEDNTYNLINEIDNKFKITLQDKNINSILKEKLVTLIEKKKKIFNENQENQEIIINDNIEDDKDELIVPIDEDIVKEKENENKNKKINDDEKELNDKINKNEDDTLKNLIININNINNINNVDNKEINQKNNNINEIFDYCDNVQIIESKKTEEKNEEKAEEKNEEKTEEKNEEKTEEKNEEKTEEKNEEKTEEKNEDKTEDKNEDKTEDKNEDKTEDKNEEKTEDKNEDKTEDKNEEKTEDKNEEKTEEDNNNLNQYNNIKTENNEKKENKNNLDEPKIQNDILYNNFVNNLIPNKYNNNEIKNNNNNNNDKSDNFNNKINNEVNTIKSHHHYVTHKKKSKSRKKSKSSEKIVQPIDSLKVDNQKEEHKEEIKQDFENYLNFLEKEGIKKKEDIYDELNDSYNWKIIDDLIMKKNVKLEDIIKIYIDICKNKEDLNNNDIFKYNEYIKTIIEYYTNNLSKNQIEILHLNMIEIYMTIDTIVNNKNNDLNMYEIMGYLLYTLIKNKLYYMKELNNFIDKNKETQINIAKVVKYTIIASGNSSRQYHNDLKHTKLFNNNDIFTLYVTNELNEIKNK